MSDKQKKDDVFINLAKKLVGFPAENSCRCSAPVAASNPPFETTGDPQEGTTASDENTDTTCCGKESPGETGACCAQASQPESEGCCGNTTPSGWGRCC